MENDEVSARKCRPSTMIYLVGVWHAFSDFYSSEYKSIRVAGESSRRIESLERAQSYLYLSFTTVS